MLDETIFSSPEKENSSIHKARIKRKEKHKHKHAVSSPLRDLYDESDSMEEQESIVTLNQQTEFDAFGDQLLIAQADRLEYLKSKERNTNKKPYLQPTQGFLKCENFLLPMDVKKPLVKAVTMTTTDGAHIDIEISDSELLCFYKEAEKQQISKPELDVSIKIENTPPKKETNSIVDSILKDFCSSPSSPDAQTHSPIFLLQNKPSRSYNQRSVSVRLNFALQHSTQADKEVAVSSDTLSPEDDSPRFLFNKTPLRTYSRQCVAPARPNFADQCKSIAFDNECCSDRSSVLSVQEDQTHELNAAEVNRVHHSQQVRENIQNLSDFFTQNSQNSEEYNEKATSSARAESEALNLFSERMEQTFIVVNNVDRCSLHDINESTVTKSDGKINRIDSIVPDITPKEELKDDIFGECGNEWNGESDDFFKNFKTQEIFVPKNSNDKECDNVEMPIVKEQQTSKHVELLVMHQNNKNEYFELCSEKKPSFCSVAKEGEKRDAAISQDFPELLGMPQNNTKKEYEQLSKDENQITEVGEKEVPKIFRNHFANDEQCIASSSNTKPQLTTDIQIEESGNFETEIKSEHYLNECATLNQHKVAESIENKEFVGFLTASKKSINISEAAKKRAASILTNLPEIPQKRGKYQIPQINSQENNLNGINEKDACTSLLVETELNGYNINVIHTNTEGIPESIKDKEFMGFLTASKKSIKISEAAKERAASILTNLPEIPQEREKYSMPRLGSQENKVNYIKEQEQDACKLSGKLSIETKLNAIHANAEVIPDDIVLSEWPFEEDSKMLETEIKLEPSAIETKTIDTYSKIISKSNTENNLLQNCSINRIADDTLRLTESNLSLASPLSSRATKRVATRRNLLSLSRSKNIKTEIVSKIDSARRIDALDTPCKKHNYLANKTSPDLHQTPDTPNLKEFFSMATNTSTPARSNEINQNETIKSSNIDTEFNATAKALSTNKLCDISCESITLKRLSMYDKSPAISPISKPNSSTINNCRVSGLRRRSGRNIKKN